MSNFRSKACAVLIAGEWLEIKCEGANGRVTSGPGPDCMVLKRDADFDEASLGLVLLPGLEQLKELVDGHGLQDVLDKDPCIKIHLGSRRQRAGLTDC